MGRERTAGESCRLLYAASSEAPLSYGSDFLRTRHDYNIYGQRINLQTLHPYNPLGYRGLLDSEGEVVNDHEGQVGAVGVHLDGHPRAGVLDLAFEGDKYSSL